MQKVKILKRVGRQLYRSSPTILTVVASIGVIATTITAVQATPKAIKLLKEAELEKGENLTKLEIVRARYLASGADLYSFCTAGSFNYCLYLWSECIKSKETGFFDECIRYAQWIL